MASFTVSVSNSFNLFGVAPSDKWNAYNWNAFIWGEGTADLPIQFDQWIIDAGTVTLDSAVAIDLIKAIGVDNTLDFSVDMTSETLTDSAGYTYVFPDRVTDAEDRSFAVWSDNSVTAASWTCAPAGATVWS